MKSAKRVYLHIGMSKAGSSAVQDSLRRNQEILERLGFCIPTTGRIQLSHAGMWRELRQSKRLSLLKGALLEDVAAHSIVITCEAFWLSTPEEVDHLARALAGYETEVLLYLRRPWNYLPSSYRQGIRRKGRTESCSGYLASVRAARRMDYPALLERWGSHFRLRVRAYEAVGNAIEADFLEAIGAGQSELDTSRQIVNPTPADGSVRLMRLANKTLPRALGRRLCRILERLNHVPLLPPIDDRQLRQYGRTVVQEWDRQVLEAFLPRDDIDLLISPGNNAPERAPRS